MDSSDYTSIASVIIALLAFGVAIWQGITTRTHNILSVTPLLNINIDNSDGLKFSLENHGLGPGLIKAFIIKVGNKEYINPIIDPYQEIIQYIGLCTMEYEYFLPTEGAAHLPEQTKTLLSLKGIGQNQNINIYSKVEEKIEFIVLYQSIYKDKTFACGSKAS